jgi:hypothetical protein
MTAGLAAERRVHDRLRAALPADYRLYPNVHWVAGTADHRGLRRFKGLERPALVLVELRPDDRRAEQLLYVGAGRATQHLVVIGPKGAVT